MKDNTPPILTTPFDEIINANCGEIPPKPVLTFTDNCSNNVSVVYTQTTINQTATSYTIIREWVATDLCGNSATFRQTINVSINDAFTNISASLCTEDLRIDLFSLLPSSTPTTGTWVDTNSSGGLQGSILNPSAIALGNYLLTYNIADPLCPKTIQITMNINDDCIVLPCSITDLKISKVVTPNNDNHNDYFEIGGLSGCGFIYDVKIFNRWGALVYENPNYKNDWYGLANGSINGNSNLPAGTYYYIVDIKNSGFKEMNGYIYLGTKN